MKIENARGYVDFTPMTCSVEDGRICISTDEMNSSRLSLNGEVLVGAGGWDVQLPELKVGDEALVFRLTKRVQDPRKKGGLGLGFVVSNSEHGLLRREK